MSNALLAAAASGKAIIASDTPENRTIITNNHSGLLTQYNDTASLAKAMQILLSSPQKRTQLGTHAKISANRFSLEKQAHLFARLTKQYIA